MNVVCVICSDLLTPSDDVFSTACGHIFHFACLMQWLERSQSCPQCREKTTRNKIQRVYFNFSNNDIIKEDPCSLVEKIENLNFQILLKDKDIKHYTEKIQTLEKQTKGLRLEVQKVEVTVKLKNDIIYALKEQNKILKTQCNDIQSANEEIVHLKKKIEQYKNIETLLSASSEDVDDMISVGSDPATLITYISVLKREMTVGLNKRRELRDKARSLQQELTKVSMERNFLSEEHSRRKKLEEDLILCESEKIFVQNELENLKKGQKGHEETSEHESKTSKEECSSQSRVKTFYLHRSDKVKKNEGTEEKHNSTTKDFILKLDKNEEKSPYLPVKSQGVSALYNNPNAETLIRKYSILSKKFIRDRNNKRSQSGMFTYDGFGGHSKPDLFPAAKMRKLKDAGNKSKKTDIGDNRKLDNML